MKRPENIRSLFTDQFLTLVSCKSVSVCKILLLIIVFSGVIGCRSTKEVVRHPSEKEAKRLEQLVSENGNFEYLNSKVEFMFFPKEGVSAGMKGTLRMRRDSCLILSVQPFAGIEAVRCLIRKDSLFVVSRLHQTYAVEDLGHLKYAQYLNMELIQSILSNRIFVPGKPKPTANDLNKFEWHKQKDGNFFRWPDENYIFDFCMNDEGQYSEFRASNPEIQEKLAITYSLFEEKGTDLFPYRVLFSVERPEKAVKFQITYLRPNFDTPADLRFDIPSRYKKVTIAELVKRFQSML